jgi:hypothetical protein
MLAPAWGFGQVYVALPRARFNRSEGIPAKVVNTGSSGIVFCIEYGQWSCKEAGCGDIKATPIPFYVQRKAGGKWSALLIGPDMGSIRVPNELEPGHSNEFPYRLNESGEMRFVVDYWIGRADVNCKNPPKHAKKAVSRTFSVE